MISAQKATFARGENRISENSVAPSEGETKNNWLKQEPRNKALQPQPLITDKVVKKWKKKSL